MPSFLWEKLRVLSSLRQGWDHGERAQASPAHVTVGLPHLPNVRELLFGVFPPQRKSFLMSLWIWSVGERSEFRSSCTAVLSQSHPSPSD